MYTRLSKVFLVWAVALFASLVVFNNLTDYDSNYRFVAHVIKMDTTFPENRDSWRAIDSPWFHHAVYGFIIVLEAVIAALCWSGGFRLLRLVNEPTRYHRAKGVAIMGLTLGLGLWFTGFMTVAGEWFLMWQSTLWNGQQAAFRLLVIFAFVLLYLVLPDRETDA